MVCSRTADAEESEERAPARSTDHMSPSVAPARRAAVRTLLPSTRISRDRNAVALAPAQCRHGDARGLEVSPGSLLQNELVQRQIRDRLAQPAVLELKLLQALDLLNLQPAKLLTPAIVGHLAHTDLPNRLRHALALRDQNVDLAQLRDDLFGLVALPCHYSPPGCQKTYLKSDHFNGGGSGGMA